MAEAAEAMRQAILKAANLVPFLQAVRKAATLIAPVASEGGAIFAEVEQAEQAAESPLAGRIGDGVNTRLSLKGVFFPQREVLLAYRAGELESVAEIAAGTPPAPSSHVVWGARPCDARSMTWLDRVFGGGEREDPYFLNRRAATVIVALACDAPSRSCFCTSVGGSPYGADGSDVLASATEGGDLLLEAYTDRGVALLERNAALLAPATSEDMAARERRAKAAASKLSVLDFAGVKAKLDGSFDSPLWGEITQRCLGCGACTYVCPTCHCFDITDESRGDQGVRVRTWDGCQFSLFTQHASGHNPRPHRKARMRQRLMHKYSYTVETVGAVFCSGCGRCVRSCPVNLDIREMLAQVKALP